MWGTPTNHEQTARDTRPSDVDLLDRETGGDLPGEGLAVYLPRNRRPAPSKARTGEAILANGLLLLGWFLVIGWVLLIVDKIAGTTMAGDILLPAGKFKVIHPTRGTLFGFTAVLVPFRLAWLVLSALFALVVALLRLHPYLALYFKKKTPEYVSPEILVATFQKEGYVP